MMNYLLMIYVVLCNPDEGNSVKPIGLE